MFITFEGLDGAGKSTQIERLNHTLLQHGKTVEFTREPGGTPIGDAIRTMLLSTDNEGMCPQTEALLYAASRAQLLSNVIRPALVRGDIVLCDRYVDASIAYQGAGLNLGMEAVGNINRFATGGLQPDLTFLFDLPVSESQTRVSKSRAHVAPDRIERRDGDYFQRVRQCFLSLAASDPSRVVILDATHTPKALEQEIWDVVAKRL